MKKEFLHPAYFFLVFIIAFLIIAPLRRFIYSTFNSQAEKVGLIFNDIASDNYISWVNSQSQEFESPAKAVFLNKEVPFKDIALSPTTQILGEKTGVGEKWIEVDISDQRLNMKDGDTTVGTFLVSTGKWYPTPKGEWKIWTKLRYTRMKGGSKALGTFYDLPNVPYTMYYNQGYGIHGAYWHNNFGHPMSHGCVNMKPEEAGIVFNWANVGTRVVVHQ